MKNRFLAWLTSTDTPSTQFASSDDHPYMPLSAVIDSALKGDIGTTSRESAMRVMAILKGRNMICNIATLPLVLLNSDRKVTRDPLFEQFDPQVANVVHLAMTIEDLLFDGIAWWEVTEREPLGRPKHVKRIDSRRVSLQPPRNGIQNPLPSGWDPNAILYVDGKPKNALNYIRFDSPNPPFLLAAKRAVKRAALLEAAAEMYADNPAPSDYFTPANGYEPEDAEEVKANIRTWIASRKQHSTGYVPSTLEYHTVQSPTPHELQLNQLQQQASLDIANGLGVDPEDLGVSTTSRTYQNATDRRQDRVNDVLSPFMRAITDRLSMPDITKAKHRAAFRLDDYMRADPKTRWETHKIAHELGATDIAEIREDEDWVDRPDLNEAEPEPAKEPEPANGAPVEQEGSLMDQKELVTFSTPEKPASQTFRFDGDAITFAADKEKRTITGTILLYGVEADNGFGRFTFKKGALEWNKGAVSRVKFLRDHDWGQLLGHALSISATDSNVSATFKVAPGDEGDRNLALAEAGTLDGLSVGIDIIEWEDDREGNFTVTKAILNETSLTPRPAFEDARLTKVTASKKDTPKENTVPEENKTPDPTPADFSKLVAEAVNAAFAAKEKEQEAKAAEATKAAELAKADKAAADAKTEDATKAAELAKKTEEESPVTPINPTGNPTPGASFEVKEKSPYTFDAEGRFAKGEHEFSTDLVDMLKSQDFDGTRTEAGKRAMAHISQGFVSSGDVNELNPPINEPSKYYEPRAQRTPLWNMINKGGLPNGLQPFTMPKFSSAGNLVSDHTEGEEPVPGTFATTSQTITPSAVSGKVNITRETWDMGGNPATSTLIWNRMVREYNKALEGSTATFLNGLAPTTIALPVGATDAVLAAALQAALVSLTFADDYDFEAFALEQNLYERLANLVDGNERPLYPVVGAQNANGSVGNQFQSLNINGLRGVPAPALPHTPGNVNASLLFDPEVVVGYATGPQRLEFAGSTTTDATPGHVGYAPVAGIDLAIWGYKAHAVIDLAGVRKVTYDTVA